MEHQAPLPFSKKKRCLEHQGYKIIFKIEELLLSRCAVRDGIVILTADYLRKSRIIFVSLWFVSVNCCIPIVQQIVGVTKDCVGSNYELEIGSEKRTAWGKSQLCLLLPWNERNTRLFQNSKIFLFVLYLC